MKEERMKGRLLVALLIAVLSLVGYYGARQQNPVTGETQHIRLSPEQEIALGLQARPELAEQFGGLSRDQRGQALVDQVGNRLVSRSDAKNAPYRYEFHLLDDDRTINAFALPGGQVFITDALYRKLSSEGALAGVLGHEIGHVVGRHGAEHLAKAQLIQGLGSAGVIAASDPDNPQASQRNAVLAQAIGQLISMRFGREDEIDSDKFGVQFMADAGYDPRSMIRVMEVLAAASKGGRQPEFFSTHPSPDRRIQRIQEAIKDEFPQGVPAGLQK
jgi:beta-barrel assembly-enhancing protease